LALEVIKNLRGKLPMLTAFSSNFTTLNTGAGKTIQVGLVGKSSAAEFGASGYLAESNATLTKTDVTLKHFISTHRFRPIDVKEYGMQYLVNSFAPSAADAIAEKCLSEIGALVTAANYSSNVNSGAAVSYAELVTAKGVLDAAKAGSKRAYILNSTYTNDLLSDSQIIGAAGLGAQVIQSGLIGSIAGGAVYQYTNLPTNSENLAGWACGSDSIAVASAVPLTEIAGADVSQETDPESGITIQVVMFQEQGGFTNITAEVLFGCAVGRSTSLHRLKTA
jgi:hypothetical protein